jgi:16S rRNA (guanine527-N7)-methyltransferase
MPPEAGPDAGRLRALAEAIGLGLSDRQVGQLLSYLDLLLRWNATYNLTAVRDRDAAFTQHLADCLAVVPAVRRQLGEGATTRRALDVGSGGGLPGAVLAICMDALDVTCVDAVGKKAAFVREVAGQLGLAQLHAAHARVEALRAAPFDLITSRAFASLRDFVGLTRPLLGEKGVWMAMKGRAPDDEIAALPGDIEVFHVEPLRVPGLDAERCLVWMRARAAT